MSAPEASPRSVCPSASQGWASRATRPRSPRAPYQTFSVFGRYEKNRYPWKAGSLSYTRTSGSTSRPPAPAPNSGIWSLNPIYPDSAQGAPEVSEGRPKLRARGRLPLAASAGSSVRQSKGARSRGMPARQLPAAGAAASCGGPRGSDVHAHHGRSRGRPPAAALFPGGWAALGSQGLPGTTGTQARSFTALAPAPCAPRPCAPSRGRGTSEAQGRRALRPRAGPPLPRPIPPRSAPGSCAPLLPLWTLSLSTLWWALRLPGLGRASLVRILWFARQEGMV